MQEFAVQTSRLRQWVRQHGEGTAVLFIHGNASDSVYWEEVMLALPEGYRAIAPDLRGYGQTEDVLIDATRGVMDWVDDLLALLKELNVDRYHVVGHSLGGAVIWGLLAADAPRILSVTLAAPGSPFGFGGTRDAEGNPTTPDFAGSGGGTVNPDFPARIARQDTSDEGGSPRDIMNRFYWKPPFRAAREDALLEGLLREKTGPDRYPGDFVASENWPGMAPGIHGPINAISAKYVGDTVQRLLAQTHKPPVLWIRGDSDQIVSDQSLFELGTLGLLGAVPGYPGQDAYPPQPMVSQTRHVLEAYGPFKEVVFQDVGHTPYIEKPDEFMAEFVAHLKSTQLETSPAQS
ncbi:alpha/beta hydrolase [Deinococcus cellulosilyticus]|uniref:Alpha/beta hydrolase n=1 Tax=Deinococcus cellulosilyticus (strain DSM 18568 / NBRC 106333 / KACC 11606 / 5516J-15) TaxID=1223518 RepID=A0A511N2U1_DEIC1|nr:alpha/beta hydrolase [Deinococcus cellulosilyticus]GEM47164.1 alpha/beta hydrolase [Deinococcus cellulosilyticus NBRC 106333 = KACC 11606]